MNVLKFQLRPTTSTPRSTINRRSRNSETRRPFRRRCFSRGAIRTPRCGPISLASRAPRPSLPRTCSGSSRVPAELRPFRWAAWHFTRLIWVSVFPDANGEFVAFQSPKITFLRSSCRNGELLFFLYWLLPVPLFPNIKKVRIGIDFVNFFELIFIESDIFH